jgi:glycosyltransferase involved in cell wall biosynthesis
MQERTITVVVPTYNEANNIHRLLTSIAAQRLREKFVLSEIVVVDDASTDNTVKEALAVQDPRVVIVSDGVRKGKNDRMNYIFSRVNSDILIQLDADIVLKDADTVANLVSPFLGQSSNVAMVCGDHSPLPPRTWVERVAYFGEMVWLLSVRAAGRKALAFRCYGHIRAFSKSFYKIFSIPEGLRVNEDTYSYLWARNKELPVAFTIKAEVGYRLPNNLTDYVKQFRRTRAYQNQTLEAAQTDEVPAVPASILFWQLLYMTVRTRPDVVLGFIILRLYCWFMGDERSVTNIWDISSSTKEIN